VYKRQLIGWWWPSARMVVVLIDSITALLVWRIGTLLYGRRGALAAGLLYAASPIALLAAVRVGQDSLITALGLAGLLLLLSVRSSAGAALAGVCLGLAIWFKYPALLFLPVYLLAAPRRALVVIAAAVMTDIVVFAPFAHQLYPLAVQSVGWQLLHHPRRQEEYGRSSSPVRRSTAALATQINAVAQPRPCFLGRANRRALAAVRCPSPAKHLAGRS